MASTIAPARAALFALLEAADYDDADVEVVFGRPDAYAARKVVALGAVIDSSEEPEQLGNRKMEEEYTVLVGVKVHGPELTDTAQAIEAEGFRICDVVRDVVNANLTLSATVRTALNAGAESPGVQPAVGGGWVIFLVRRIDITARIT